MSLRHSLSTNELSWLSCSFLESNPELLANLGVNVSLDCGGDFEGGGYTEPDRCG